jgi:hypothetical protein
LIDSVNPFQKAFEILSKSVTSHVLRVIQEAIEASKIQVTEDEAQIVWPKIKEFVKRTGNNPDFSSPDPLERRMAEVVIYLRNKKREYLSEQK